MGISKGKRKGVYKRDGYQCLKCEVKEGLTIDHIVPRSKGGKNCAINLQTLCKTCNQRKGSQIIVMNGFNRSKEYARRFQGLG